MFSGHPRSLVYAVKIESRNYRKKSVDNNLSMVLFVGVICHML